MGCRNIPKKKRSSGVVPVYLNVYDLTSINGYAYWFGLGIYHSGVQVYHVEYAFGGHDNPTTGVFDLKPKQCPGFMFRKSILIGWTNMGTKAVQNLIDDMSLKYKGNTYNLVTRNCNHFSDELCYKLTGKSIPRWVNRLARVGQLCYCVLPESITGTKIKQVTLEDNVVVAKDESKQRSKKYRPHKFSSIHFSR